MCFDFRPGVDAGLNAAQFTGWACASGGALPQRHPHVCQVQVEAILLVADLLLRHQTTDSGCHAISKLWLAGWQPRLPLRGVQLKRKLSRKLSCNAD